VGGQAGAAAQTTPVGDRPGPFLRRTLWVWAGALLAIYLVVLAIVAAAR